MAKNSKLKCAVNGVGCTSDAKFVCHHCGLPLCDGPNCCKWRLDPAMAGWPVANHCPDHDHVDFLSRLVRGFIHRSNRLLKSPEEA